MKNARIGTNENKIWNREKIMASFEIDTSIIRMFTKYYYEEIVSRKAIGTLDIKILMILKSLGCQTIGKKCNQLTHLHGYIFTSNTSVHS